MRQVVTNQSPGGRFTSDDFLVTDLADRIEAAYPARLGQRHGHPLARRERTAEDHDPEKRLRVEPMLGNEAALYLVEVCKEAALRRYIGLLPDDERVVVDNNHGWLAPAHDYKRAIAQDAD